MERLNNAGYCDTIPIYLLKLLKLYFFIFSPSILTYPNTG